MVSNACRRQIFYKSKICRHQSACHTPNCSLRKLVVICWWLQQWKPSVSTYPEKARLCGYGCPDFGICFVESKLEFAKHRSIFRCRCAVKFDPPFNKHPKSSRSIAFEMKMFFGKRVATISRRFRPKSSLESVETVETRSRNCVPRVTLCKNRQKQLGKWVAGHAAWRWKKGLS